MHVGHAADVIEQNVLFIADEVMDVEQQVVDPRVVPEDVGPYRLRSGGRP